MSQKQLNKYVAISKLIDGQITVKEASECLGFVGSTHIVYPTYIV